MSLFKLIYTSKRTDICDEAAIQDILRACRKNNPSRDITGVLLHTNNNFIQYLEGSLTDLNQLFNLIKTDPRHHRVVMLALSPIQERLFPSWHMGYKDIDTNKVGFHTQISKEEADIFERMINGSEVDDNLSSKILSKFYAMA